MLLHQFGHFYSWEIINENIARKTCDDSFYKYHGSGIPAEIRWFFGAEDMVSEKSQALTLVYNGNEYDGYIQKDTRSSGRTRIFWSAALAKLFRPFESDGLQHILEFRRDRDDKYVISFVDGLDELKTSQSGTQNSMLLKEAIEKFMKGYPVAKRETLANNPFGEFVRKDIPTTIYNTGLVDKADYLVVGSVGQGNWAMIPWICIFDRAITTTATKGVYIVYLLSKDSSELYLTFNQGCTDIRKSHSRKETIAIMREKATEVIMRIDSRGFADD